MLLRIAFVVAASFARAAEPAPAAATEQVTRGKYLVMTAGCHDCHTPWKMTPQGPGPDMTRALSGHPEVLDMPAAPALPAGPWLITIAATHTAYAGPWGVSFTANLTPDRETGIGKWNERTFIDTIRTGRHLGRGREVLPPMPIAVYQNFTDADLAAIFAYLQSIPAIKNRVPAPRPPAALAAQAGS
jgi:mono/diheme cytochrome c family protein